MKIVRIDRESIKKNPNAGSTISYMSGLWNARFVIKSDNIPEWIYKDPFYPETTYMGNNIPTKVEGSINGPIDDKFINKYNLAKVDGLRISISREIQTIEHLTPEPDYLYEYVLTFVKCKHCKNKVEVDDIEVDYILDEFKADQCPICQNYNTFPERKYEKIEEVLKSIKK